MPFKGLNTVLSYDVDKTTTVPTPSVTPTADIQQNQHINLDISYTQLSWLDAGYRYKHEENTQYLAQQKGLVSDDNTYLLNRFYPSDFSEWLGVSGQSWVIAPLKGSYLKSMFIS